MEYKEQLEKLKLELEKIKCKNNNIVCMANKSILACRNSLEYMNRSILISSFTYEEDEINFFKNIKSFPLSQIIYYSKIRTFEIEYPKVNIRKQKKYIKRKIEKIDKFNTYNIDFIQYINLGKSHLDSLYFTSKNSDNLNFTNSKTYCFSPKFSTSHDALLAKVKAFELYITYLHQKLNDLKNNKSEPGFKSNLKWTGSKAEITELVYALHTCKVIDNGSSDIKELASAIEKLLNIDMGDIYRTYIELKGRKKDRTKFIEKLKNSLIQRMDQSEE
ncbi:MAG: RteC domain-containing protein [Bacteroidota bacterium]